VLLIAPGDMTWMLMTYSTRQELVLELNMPQTIPGTLILCLESDIPVAVFFFLKCSSSYMLISD